MPNDFVNTITTQSGITYDVQDKRLTVTTADAGKVVAVDNNGNLSLITPSGGTKLYEHRLSGVIADGLQQDIGTFSISVALAHSTAVSGTFNTLMFNRQLLFLLEGNNTLKINNIWYDVINFPDADSVLVNSLSNGLEVKKTNEEQAGKICYMIIRNDRVYEL